MLLLLMIITVKHLVLFLYGGDKIRFTLSLTAPKYLSPDKNPDTHTLLSLHWKQLTPKIVKIIQIAPLDTYEMTICKNYRRCVQCGSWKIQWSWWECSGSLVNEAIDLHLDLQHARFSFLVHHYLEIYFESYPHFKRFHLQHTFFSQSFPERHQCWNGQVLPTRWPKYWGSRLVRHRLSKLIVQRPNHLIIYINSKYIKYVHIRTYIFLYNYYIGTIFL